MDEDWLVVERFLQGDATAFEDLFSRYKARVITLAFRFLKQRMLAEDVAQDVFLKMYERRFPIHRRGKFSTWLYRVTVNASLDALRARKFAPRSLDEPIGAEAVSSLQETLEDPKAQPPLEALSRQELQRRVQQAMDRLPATLRLPLLLYQFEQLTYAEIAQILGLSEKAVERRLYHARERLRKALSAYS